MNRIIIIIVILVSLISCSSVGRKEKISVTNQLADSIVATKPVLTFAENKKSFGKIKKEKQKKITVDFEFEFENTGNYPLVILKADVSCDCLSTEYPQQPLKKGEKGIIKVSIDTESQLGDFNKMVYIKSNAANDVELLRITGKIK